MDPILWKSNHKEVGVIFNYFFFVGDK